MISSDVKVQAARTEPSALRLMEGRNMTPKFFDTTELPGGAKLGLFWNNCKRLRRCGRPPYDRLLTNLMLRENYRTTTVA